MEEEDIDWAGGVDEGQLIFSPERTARIDIEEEENSNSLSKNTNGIKNANGGVTFADEDIVYHFPVTGESSYSNKQFVHGKDKNTMSTKNAKGKGNKEKAMKGILGVHQGPEIERQLSPPTKAKFFDFFPQSNRNTPDIDSAKLKGINKLTMREGSKLYPSGYLDT